MTNPIVSNLVAQLDADLREAFEERAGIMEFDAGIPREHAECLALLDVLGSRFSALLQLTPMTVEKAGLTRTVLTTDGDVSRAVLASDGWTVISTSQLTQVMNQLSGIGVLTPWV